MGKRIIRCQKLFEEKQNPTIHEDQCPVRKGEKPHKSCQNCIIIRSPKPKKEKLPKTVDSAIKKFCKATSVPEENVRFYIDIYKKINKARQDSKRSLEFLKRTTIDYWQSLKEASTDGWLQKNEVSYLRQTWQKFITKEENEGKFRMWILEKYKGKRVNPALEVLSRALLKDAEEIGHKPRYKEVSNLLISIAKENKGNFYTVSSLKDKYPMLKIPGLKFDQPPRLPASKVELICNTLIETKTYFAAKGESFLPYPLPPQPEGYVKTILQVIDARSEKIPHHPGISIPIRN